MARRIRALFLLLLSSVFFMLQGQTVVQCLCSGAIALGTAPEACCETCPEAPTGTTFTVSAEGGGIFPGAAFFAYDDCWQMATAGGDPPMLSVVHVSTPLPSVVLLAEDPSMPDRTLLRDPTPAWTWECKHRPAPLGPPCTILYGALLI